MTTVHEQLMKGLAAAFDAMQSDVSGQVAGASQEAAATLMAGADIMTAIRDGLEEARDKLCTRIDERADDDKKDIRNFTDTIITAIAAHHGKIMEHAARFHDGDVIDAAQPVKQAAE
jgi:hypothetical protein